MAKYLKTVTAGPIVRQTLYSMAAPRDGERARAEKREASTAARQRINVKNSRLALELRIAANFGPGDLFLSATYDAAHQPQTMKEVRRDVQRFLDRVRRDRKRRGQELKYIYVTEGYHGDHRPHAHIILNSVSSDDAELLAPLWPGGFLHLRRLDDLDDDLQSGPNYFGNSMFERLAVYLHKETAQGLPVGAQSWTPSRNLVKPATQTEIVPDYFALSPPPGANVTQFESRETLYASFNYLAYLLPAAKAATRDPGRSRSKPRKDRPRAA